MTVICADPSPISLYSLRKKVVSILPDADIYLCKKVESAMQTVRDYGCDVLITEIDFGRGKGEGIELAEMIGNMNPNANIIFATAVPCKDYAALILKIKFSGYMTKPYETEELKKELLDLRFKRT